ncbi:MAG TPA: hypothetical protein VMY34_07095 [Acidimicrobiales bacterium]|nr:hypothetical protein [Acidimicrobiales bacterium]
MILWFVGLGPALVWLVFRDRALDYRLVAAGALLPDVLDAGFGGARAAHSVLAGALLLGVVMLATRGRRRVRRRVLAIPIGTFVHLALDGVWQTTRVFWWPLFGFGLAGAPLPSLDRPLVLTLMMEAVGAVVLWRSWHLFSAPGQQVSR